MYAESLKHICNLNYMLGFQGFKNAITNIYYIFDEKESKIRKTYLYRDKTTTQGEEKDVVYYNDIVFIRDTKIILEKTKEITKECLKECLTKYFIDE